jgi:hypothetical protein
MTEFVLEKFQHCTDQEVLLEKFQYCTKFGKILIFTVGEDWR